MTDDAELAAIDARMAAGYPLDVDVYADRRKLRAMLDVARAESEKLVESVAQYRARLDAVNAERNAHQRQTIRLFDRVQSLEAKQTVEVPPDHYLEISNRYFAATLRNTNAHKTLFVRSTERGFKVSDRKPANYGNHLKTKKGS